MVAKNKMQALMWAKETLNKYEQNAHVNLGIKYKKMFGLSAGYLAVERKCGVTKVEFLKC